VAAVVKGPQRACLLTLLAALASGAQAHAHPEPTPTLVNRYLTLAPAGARLGLELSLLYGTLPAGEHRRRLDGDHDGTISPREVSDERRALAAQSMVQLFIDGVPVKFEPTIDIDLGGDRGTGAQPLLVSLRTSVALDPGERRLTVALGPDLPRMGETEIMLDAGNPWRLHETFDGTAQVIAAAPLVRYPGARVRPDEARGGGFVIRSDGPLVGDEAPAGSVMAPLIMVLIAIVMGTARTARMQKTDSPDLWTTSSLRSSLIPGGSWPSWPSWRFLEDDGRRQPRLRIITSDASM
jgi:hypothetical protein